MNGANNSTTFTDSGPNALAVTAVADAKISTAQSKFGGSAAYFDGTGDYLTVASNAAIAFGLGDFTIECWVNFSALPGTNLNMGIANTMTSPGGASFTHWWIGLYNNAGTNVLYLGRHGNGAVYAYSNWTPSLNTWYHIAATRSSSSVIRLFIDGVSQSVTTSGSNWANDFSATTILSIGYVATALTFNGYIDELRITKGVARYKSNFALPIRPYPDYEEAVPADPYYSSISLLLHMDGANNSTTFIDSGPNALAVTAAAGAQIQTDLKKYGSASCFFDGLGDSLTIPANPALALGTGDYTIEGWFYSYTYTYSLRGMIDFRTATTGTNGLMLRENDGGFLVFLNSATLLQTSTGRIPNQWQHIAIVRKDTTVTLYVDGVSQTSTTSSANLTDSILRISGFVDTQSSDYAYNGNIDELRITKGIARYNSNFTPPTKAYPDIYNPYTSLPVNGAVLWLDASKQSTLFTDAGTTNVKNNGDLVYQWNDLSGANNHATQTTSASRPAWSSPSNGQNVLGGVSFNGSTIVIYPTISSSNKTVFIVHKGISSSSDNRLFTSHSDYSLNVGASTYSGGNLSFVREYIAWTNSGFSRVYNPTIFNLTYTNSPSFSATLSKSENSGNTTIQTITSAGITSGDSDSFGLAGTYYEVILFTRVLTTAEMTAMNNYLRTKWGTP
jgi:hypothetical protein